jgi:pimeloyl-ACP methyl ester carboxylesterase
VLLEAGIAASSLSWRLVENELARHTTVLAYDRAGFGWSGGGGAERSMPNLVEELRGMLEECGTPGPFVLVGHSFGGLLLRHFALAHPEWVKAMVLVDPLEPFEWHPLDARQSWRLEKGVMLSRRGALLARFGVVRLGLDLLLAGSRRLPKLLAKASSGQGSVVPDRLVGEIRKLPREVWPAVRAHWCLPRSFRTLAEYLARLPEHCALPLDEARLRPIPVTVISAGKSPEDVIAAHRRTAAVSSSGRHVVAEESGHWVQLDRPGVVVREVLRACGVWDNAE